MRAISMTSPVTPGAGRMQTIVPLLIPPCFPHSMVTMGVAIVNMASLLFNYCVINSGTTASRDGEIARALYHDKPNVDIDEVAAIAGIKAAQVPHYFLSNVALAEEARRRVGNPAGSRSPW